MRRKNYKFSTPKKQKKPAPAKLKYNCGYSNNIEKWWIRKMDVSARDLWLESVDFLKESREFKKVYDMHFRQLAAKLELQEM